MDDLTAFLYQFRPDELPDATAEAPKTAVRGPMQIEKVRRLSPPPQRPQPWYELIYVLAGSVDCDVEGEAVHIAAGELLVIAANVAHSLHTCGIDDLAVSILLDEHVVSTHFYQSVCRLPTLGELFRPNLLNRWALVPLGVDSRADGYARRMLCCWFDAEPHCEIAAAELLLLLLIEADGALSRMQPRAEGGIIGEVEQIARYINANCATATLEETAQRFGYSQDYLSAAIRGYCGDSFIGYRNRCCLLRAAAALVGTDRPIAEIAAASGIPSPSFFRRLFSEQFHMSPAQYRKTYRLRDSAPSEAAAGEGSAPTEENQI